MIYKDVINFWFVECTPTHWWKKDSEFDQKIGIRFGSLNQSASKGELYQWRSSAQGALAEIIILDQFSRNIYRNTPLAFAHDAAAVVLTQEAIHKGFDKQLTPQECSFLYMPFMHSESIIIQKMAQPLFEALNLSNTTKFAQEHLEIIEEFGRFPHRNSILGRESTTQELDFLKHHQGF